MPFFLVHDANDNDNDDDDDEEEKAKVEGSSPRDDFLLLDFIDEKLLANVRTPHLWEIYNLKKIFFHFTSFQESLAAFLSLATCKM